MTTKREDPSTVSRPPASETPDTGRRKFVVAGIVAAPLMITLTARPARAQSRMGYGGDYSSQVDAGAVDAWQSFDTQPTRER